MCLDIGDAELIMYPTLTDMYFGQRKKYTTVLVLWVIIEVINITSKMWTLNAILKH